MKPPKNRRLTPRRRCDRTDTMPANGWLGERREKHFRANLAELPDLAALAATIRVPERAGAVGGRRMPGSRPPISLATVQLTKTSHHPTVVADPIGEADLAWRIGSRKQAIPDTLEAWVWLAHDEMIDDRQTPASTPAANLTTSESCAWLLRHIVWCLDQQWIAELALDVSMMIRECKAILRERPEYKPRCPRQGCGGHLVDEGSGLWRCPFCEHTAGDGGRLGLREAIAQQKPMTATAISKAFGISADTIYTWRHRGHLTPAHDGPQPTYHVLDVLRLADDRGVS